MTAYYRMMCGDVEQAAALVDLADRDQNQQAEAVL
jgi:hypothetical protein